MTQNNIQTSSNSAVSPTAALSDANCATLNCDNRRPHYSEWHTSRSARNMIAIYLARTNAHDEEGACDAFDALQNLCDEYLDDALENLSCTEEYQDYFTDLIADQITSPSVVIDAALNCRSVKEQARISEIFHKGVIAFGSNPAVTAARKGYTGELETMLAHKDAADRAAFIADMKAYPFVQVAS